jgi:hypothetical protein
MLANECVGPGERAGAIYMNGKMGAVVHRRREEIAMHSSQREVLGKDVYLVPESYLGQRVWLCVLDHIHLCCCAIHANFIARRRHEPATPSC